MTANATLSKQLALALYLVLTPLISLAIALFAPLPLMSIALLLLLVPSTAAILITLITEGGKGAAGLLKKIVQWRIDLKWYAITLALSLGIILTAGLVAFLLGWSPTFQIHIPPASQLITNFILIVLVAVLEELGWRGYALPRLLVDHSPLFSALLIGTAWGALHIGIGLVDGRPWLPTFLAPFLFSVVLTWLFVHTKGSLAMAILWHFVVDFAPQFVLSGIEIGQAVWAQVIVALVVVLVLTLLFGTNLQRSPMRRPSIMDTRQVKVE